MASLPVVVFFCRPLQGVTGKPKEIFFMSLEAKTMTVKEIALFTGKTEKTIQRWVKKASDKMSSVADKMSSAGHGKTVHYDIDEVEAILTAGSMSKDAVSILMENARKNLEPKNDPLLMILEQNNLLMAKMIEIIEDRAIPARKEPIAISAPAKSTRKELNQLVRRYADEKLNRDYQKAWNILYQETLYRMSRNVKVCAKNQGISKIAYMEHEGMIDSAISIIVELLG